jgi:hypothetical protein
MDSTTENRNVLERLTLTLQEYLDAVPRQNQPNPPDLLALFSRLDALEAELAPDCPAQLRHYMHQKSYRKAHLFLQGSDSSNVRGNCGSR